MPVSSGSGCHQGIPDHFEWPGNSPKSPCHAHQTDFRLVLGVLFVLLVLFVLSKNQSPNTRNEEQNTFFIVMWVESLAMIAVAGKLEGWPELNRISRIRWHILGPQLKVG